MQIIPFPIHYQSVYTNFDISSFSLISCTVKAAFSADESAAFSYLVENGPFFGGAGIEIVQTFTYDRKKFLR